MAREEDSDVLIFGAGPAGLAAANTLSQAGRRVVVIESEDQVGGISKTKEYQGYRFDLGGHRFFTKSSEVNALWIRTLGEDLLTRPRLSRIYYRNRFFSYPVKPFNALKGLGMIESLRVIGSYTWIKLFPYSDEDNFERWVSNRFGKRLYRHFFKGYTEKLWGIPADEIQAEWAAQRIKGLSLTSAVWNALFPDSTGKIKSLIDEFQYPKRGPGMMYDKLAKDTEALGAKITTENTVVTVNHHDGLVRSAEVRDGQGQMRLIDASYFLSSMPLTSLVFALDPAAPKDVLDAAKALTYRSFISISVILKAHDPFPDTWIYVHSPEVRLGRIQNFRAWSPYMTPDGNHVALGLEYFCTEGDELWETPDDELIDLGLTELQRIGLGKKESYVDGFVSRVPKAYPTYDASYPDNIQVIRDYLATLKNLQPIGRYGMFKYNNMDHSILTGIYAAKNILGEGPYDVWAVNDDEVYQETAQDTRP